MLLRICVTCDRYQQDQPAAGHRLALAAAEILAARPEFGCSILRVACLNGCKGPCRALITGRRPLRIGGLNPADASFLVDLAGTYALDGDTTAMMASVPSVFGDSVLGG